MLRRRSHISWKIGSLDLPRECGFQDEALLSCASHLKFTYVLFSKSPETKPH